MVIPTVNLNLKAETYENKTMKFCGREGSKFRAVCESCFLFRRRSKILKVVNNRGLEFLKRLKVKFKVEGN